MSPSVGLLDIGISVGDIVAIAGVAITAVLTVYGIGKWRSDIDHKLTIMGGKITAMSKLLLNLIQVLSETEIVGATKANKLYSDFIKDEISSFEDSVTHNPITPQMVQRRRELSAKVDDNTITAEEAAELNGILQQEMQEAETAGNVGAMLALGAAAVLVGAIIAALSGEDEDAKKRGRKAKKKR